MTKLRLVYYDEICTMFMWNHIWYTCLCFIFTHIQFIVGPYMLAVKKISIINGKLKPQHSVSSGVNLPRITSLLFTMGNCLSKRQKSNTDKAISKIWRKHIAWEIQSALLQYDVPTLQNLSANVIAKCTQYKIHPQKILKSLGVRIYDNSKYSIFRFTTQQKYMIFTEMKILHPEKIIHNLMPFCNKSNGRTIVQRRSPFGGMYVKFTQSFCNQRCHPLYCLQVYSAVPLTKKEIRDITNLSHQIEHAKRHMAFRYYYLESSKFSTKVTCTYDSEKPCLISQETYDNAWDTSYKEYTDDLIGWVGHLSYRVSQSQKTHFENTVINCQCLSWLLFHQLPFTCCIH